MNILIPYSWLKEYLKTDLGPKEFASVVSLYGPSIERWHETADNDVVFDVEITTNRVDAYSVFGMAREAHAILQYNNIPSSLIEPETPELINRSGVNYELYAEVDPGLCPRFTAMIIDGVTVGQSPDFIKDRLEKVGERSLNNLVDITNYCMYELGQPMHVFDYDKIVGHKMVLRKSRAGETLTTLDNVKRTLPDGAIVIEDAEKLIDLAGIMGGKNSAIDEETKRVLLFVQTYDPHTIRKTAMHLAHRTEAAARFEKDLDEESVLPALKRAATMITEYAAGTIASELIDIYPRPQESKTVSVRLEQVQATIGIAIEPNRIETILSLLGFDVLENGDTITVSVPSFRSKDISIPQDLIEEIARMYGYHNIPATLPGGQIPNRPENTAAKRITQIKMALKYLGFTEVYTNSATGKENIESIGIDANQCVTIKNPLTQDFVYMRPHLLATMLPVVAENLPRFPKLNIFELSRIYYPKKDDLPFEKTLLQILSTDLSVLVMKGIGEALLGQVGISAIETRPYTDTAKLDPASAGKMFNGKSELATVGLIAPHILQSFNISQSLTSLNIDIDRLIEFSSDATAFHPIAKYPALVEDISFVVDQDEPVGPIVNAVSRADKLIVQVDVLDMFASGRVGEGNKSITLRISYQSPTKLLSEKNTAKARQKVEHLLTKTFTSKIRK